MIGYIKARLSERSTWIGIVAAATGAAALAAPWSYVAMAAGAIAAIIPERTQ